MTDSIRSAEIADTTVPPVAAPAADAVDCMQFVSRIVIGDFAMRALSSTFQIPYARIAAVIATPRLHPVLSPTYRFVNARTNPRALPIASARQVSCGASAPR